MTIIQAHNVQSFKAELERFVATSYPQASTRDLTNLYRTAPAVYATSNYRGTNVAAVQMIVKDVATDKPLPDDHPAVKPFRHGYYNYMQRSELTNFFWGYNLLYKQRNLLNKPMALRWINPHLYDLDTNSGGLRRFRIMRSGYNYERVTDETYIEPHNAVYQHGVDFGDDFDGVSEAEVAFLSGGLSVEMAATVLAFFRNRAVPAAIAQPADDKAEIGVEDKNALTAFLRRAFQGAINAGRVLVSRDRWEWIQLQAKFDDLAMPELIKGAREDVFLVSGVPMVLLISGASSYAEFEGARRAWLQNWLVPRLWWYAGIFTDQLVKEFGNYKVEPDLSSIPGLKEDAATRANVVNSQVSGGYMTLYDAQLANEHEKPDEALEGFYVINGVLTHRNQLLALKQAAAPLPLDELPPTTPTDGDPPPQGPKLVDDQPHPLPARPKSAGYPLSDEVFTELRNWEHIAGRKGAKHAFVCLHVRRDVELRLIERLASAADVEAMKAAFAYARELSALRAIASTRLEFDADFADLLAAARGDMDRRRFSTVLRAMLRKYGEMAYRDGLIDGGVEDGVLDDEDRAALNTALADQSQYVTGLGEAIYKDDKVTSAVAEQKPDLWWNKSIMPLYNAGVTSAAGNQMQEFVIGNTDEHCVDCLALNGVRARRTEFAKRELIPPTSRTACQGWNCSCLLVNVKGRARGTFPSKFAARFMHDHTHSLRGEPADPIEPDEFEHYDASDGMDDSHLLVSGGEPEKPKNEDV